MNRLLFVLLFSAFLSPALSQDGARRNFHIPDAAGFYTLKGDFHTHTVFSDGLVWPTLRILEAWQEGLDVIAITDHIEYRPLRDDVNPDLNRSHEIALPKAEQLGILLVKGAEITRSMPPGHSNALFLNDVSKLDTEEWSDAFAEAGKQGAFIFWNHPGWKAQQPDTTIWFPEHDKLLADGLLHGIEIVNYKEYYPQAFAWALEKDLTIMANSDIHGSIHSEYHSGRSDVRPFTLVFARERSVKGVKDALMDKRTAAYYNGNVYGRGEWLEKLFDACTGQEVNAAASGNGKRSIFLTNYSGIGFYLVPGEEARKAGLIYDIELPPYSTIGLTLKVPGQNESRASAILLEYSVTNMFTSPESCLKTSLRF